MLLPLILAVASFLVYANAIYHPFVHDDVIFILHNPHIGRLDNLSELFFPIHNQQVLMAGLNSYYRPVLDLFYRLEYHFFGFNATYFHFVNIVLHALNGLLLYALFCRLQIARVIAFSVSLLFLIHPVQTEAVACVSGASNLLCTFFLLLTLISYLRGWMLFACGGFILAILTKEQAIMFLPLIILIDWYRRRMGQYIMWLVFAVLTVAFLLLRLNATGSHLLGDVLGSMGEFQLRLLSIPQTILMYLRLIIMPWDLHYYRNTNILEAYQGGLAACLILMGLLFLLIKRFPEIKREMIFGVGWFLICLFPVLNIVPLINEYSLILTAEHFLYLPMAGFIMVLAITFRRIILSKILLALMVLITVSFMGLSMCQNYFWKDEITLFERMITFEENFGRGHILLAKAYYARQHYDFAVHHYLRALEIMEGYEQKVSNGKAKDFYRSYIQEVYSDLITIYFQNGKYVQALEYLNKALELNPHNVNLLNNIAVCYLSLNDKVQAEAVLKTALSINPTYAPAKDNLNKLLNSN